MAALSLRWPIPPSPSPANTYNERAVAAQATSALSPGKLGDRLVRKPCPPNLTQPEIAIYDVPSTVDGTH